MGTILHNHSGGFGGSSNLFRPNFLSERQLQQLYAEVVTRTKQLVSRRKQRKRKLGGRNSKLMIATVRFVRQRCSVDLGAAMSAGVFAIVMQERGVCDALCTGPDGQLTTSSDLFHRYAVKAI